MKLNPWRRPDRIVIYEDAAGGYRWKRVAPNGRIVADSGESYTRRQGALSAAVTRNPGCTVELRNKK